jgi:hypothetical protein
LLRRFTDEQNDHALFIGWYDYAIAANAMPLEAQVHQAWYIALHPDKLAKGYSTTVYEEVFPNLRVRPRVEQKQVLNDVIARYRLDAVLMNDPRTDPSDLVLGWQP